VAEERTDANRGGKLGIKRIDHVSIATADISERTRFFEELFGIKITGRFDQPEAGFNAANLSIPGSDTELELLEPNGDQSFVARFLEGGGSMYHHVTFEVYDIEKAAAALRDCGIEPFGLRTETAWNKELFIHPRDTGGVLTQLYEAGPGGWG